MNKAQAKAPFETIVDDAEPAPPQPLLQDRDITAFISVWKRFMAYVGREYSDFAEVSYRPLFEKNELGFYRIKRSLLQSDYYPQLRSFLIENFQVLIRNYLAKKRVGAEAKAILLEIASSHYIGNFYAMEHFANGNALFYDVEHDRCFYVHKNYDPFAIILPQKEELFQILLLSYKGRIITDGVIASYHSHTGPTMQASLLRSYKKAREHILYQLPQKREEIPPVSYVYQLKISLKYAKPPVWRTTLIDPETDLSTLHEIIQLLFGWDDNHLHMFKKGQLQYGPPETFSDFSAFGDPDHKEESRYTLSDLLGREKEKADYIYDFGDNWHHILELQAIRPKEENIVYPFCLRGRGDNFKEDSGWGLFSDAEEEQGKSFDKEKINLSLRHYS
jgi:hypothetical protein